MKIISPGERPMFEVCANFDNGFQTGVYSDVVFQNFKQNNCGIVTTNAMNIRLKNFTLGLWEFTFQTTFTTGSSGGIYYPSIVGWYQPSDTKFDIVYAKTNVDIAGLSAPIFIKGRMRILSKDDAVGCGINVFSGTGGRMYGNAASLVGSSTLFGEWIGG